MKESGKKRRWRKIAFSALLIVALLGSFVAVPITQTAFADSVSGAVRQIAAGGVHSLAVLSDGTVVAWGSNDQGQTNVPAGLRGVAAVSAGMLHSLALKSDGTVVAWGNDDYNQTDVPAGLNNVVAIAAGGLFSLALKADGKVVAWGRDTDHETEVPANLDHVIAIAAGDKHSLALKSDGKVVAWGFDVQGQANVPATLNDVMSIAAGGYHSLALRSNGAVVAWGSNDYNQTSLPAGLSNVTSIAGGMYQSFFTKSDGTVIAIGFDGSGQSSVPAGLNGILSVAGGGAHALALKADGTLAAWGNNASGQTNVPTSLSTPVKGKTIGVGSYHLAALKTDGTVAAWGDHLYGQASVPAGLNHVKAISAGDLHSLALKSDGTVVAWGFNGNGQAGVPGGLDDVASIAAGGYQSFALKTDGTVIAWGNNISGQISIPTNLGDVKAIASGNESGHTLALKSDGTVVAWGDSTNGQTNVPAGLDHVKAIAIGGNVSMALKSDGTVVAWGDSTYGQTNVPAGLDGVVTIAVGRNHALALRANGTVVAWGDNLAEQTSVPSDLNEAVAIAAGSASSAALKSDGTIVAWGVYDQSLVPGNASLSDLTLQEAALIPTYSAPSTAVAQDTYAYIGVSATSVHVKATLADSSQTALYIDGKPASSGSVTAVNATGVSTVIPIRVEPYLLEGRTYTITAIRDSIPPEVHFSVNGNAASAQTAATKVTLADTESGLDAASLQYAWSQDTAVPVSGWTSFANEDTLTRNGGDGNWYLHIRAEDRVGNTTDQVTAPFVLDNTPPMLTLNGRNPMNVPLGQPYAEPGATATDHIDGTIPSSSIAITGTVNTSVSGTYRIAYQVSDHAGNTVSVTRVVYVSDGPVITLSGANPMVIEVNSVFTDPGAAAFDPEDGALVPTVTGSVYTNRVGTYTLAYEVSDHVGNEAPTVTRTVYVIAPPVITLIGPSVMSLQAGQSFTDPGARAADSYYGDISSLITVNGTVDAQTPGTYTLSYRVRDPAGISAAAVTRIVTVIPRAIAPLPDVSPVLSGNTELKMLRFTGNGKALAISAEGKAETDLEQIEIVAEPADSDSVVTLNGERLGLAGTKRLQLSEGDNAVILTVKAPNGTAKTYSYVIHRTVSKAPACGFMDIGGHWAAADICKAAAAGIVQGDSAFMFHPDYAVTRAQFVVMLVRALKGTGSAAAALAFTDQAGIPEWARSEIQYAIAHRIVEGYADGTFKPQQTITRAEMAVLIAKALGLAVDLSGRTAFEDDAELPAWAKPYVHADVREGLLQGKASNRFMPNESATRAEAAAIMLRVASAMTAG